MKIHLEQIKNKQQISWKICRFRRFRIRENMWWTCYRSNNSMTENGIMVSSPSADDLTSNGDNGHKIITKTAKMPDRLAPPDVCHRHHQHKKRFEFRKEGNYFLFLFFFFENQWVNSFFLLGNSFFLLEILFFY